jgi:hypothetical protein
VTYTTYGTAHPHEPEIPPAFDPDCRCLVCGLLVRVDALERENRTLRDALDQYADEAET